MLAPYTVLDDAGPVDIDPGADVLLTPVPPDESFWRKHSSHLEFPQSLLISTFLVACMFGLVVACLYLALGPGPMKRVPPISMADGDDDSGLGNVNAGSEGGQGGTTPLAPTTPSDVPPSIIPDVTVPLPTIKQPVAPTDPTGALPIPTTSFNEALDGTDKKLLQGPPGATGPGQGRDGTGTEGGTRGTGRDKTRARSLRWVIKFTTSGGQDYLNQLAALNAVVLVPVPGQTGQYYLFKDLLKPNFGPVASDSDMVQYSGQVQFCDSKPDSVRGVGQALRLPFAASEFYAVFPPGIENKLADLEKRYRSLPPERIAETRFQVTVNNGDYVFVVVGQTEK